MSKLDFGKRSITVQGVEVSLDTESMVIGDIDTAQRRASADMAWWASVWGEAESELEAADAFYRRWKAKLRLAILDEAGAKKPADHHINAIIEANDRFYELKQAIGVAKRNAKLAEGVFKAMDKGANMAQSLGAARRKVMETAGGVATRASKPDSAPKRTTTKPSSAPNETEANKARLKAALKSKRKKDGD